MSTTATAPKSMDALLSEIESYNDGLSKAANLQSQAPEKDPAEKGTKDIPKDPEASKKKQNQPPDATNTEGAPEALAALCATNPVPTGQDVPSTQNGDKKDESVSSPTDSLAKIAEATNAVLASMAGFQKTQADPTKAAAAPAAAAPTKTAAGTPDAAAALAAAAGTPAAEAAKAATSTEPGAKWTPEFHFKLAQAIMETEEGCRFAETIITKKAGTAVARELVGRALQAQAEFNHMAELEKAAAKAQEEGIAAADEMLKNASEADKAAIVKFAKVHGSNLQKCANAYEVQAYNLGAMDAAAILDSAQAIQKAAAAKKAGMMPPGAAGGDPTGGAAAGGPPGGDPTGGAGGAPGGDPSIPGGQQGPMELPEIMQLLAEMVQNGEIPQEVGQALAQQLQQAAAGGAGGGGAPGGDADPSAAAGGPPGGGAPGGEAPDAGGAPAGGADDEPEEAKAAMALLNTLAPAVA